jgi:hypothetical protein
LGENEIGGQRGELRGVYGVEGGPAVRRPTDGVGDLAAGEHGVVEVGTGDDGDRFDAGWPVALVRAADQVVELAQLGDQVGGGGEKRDDPHGSTVDRLSLLYNDLYGVARVLA